MNRIASLVLIVAVCLILSVPTAFGGDEPLMMATTTSTDNTGLLDELMPVFTKDTGIRIKWVATGTGKALKMGQACDVDVLMVHAPAAEKAFVAKGYGTDRRTFMFNDFVIIGPAADSAGVRGNDAAAALAGIAKAKAVFVSRGDDSGTHKKEKSLWKGAGLKVDENARWYLQAGQGMMATIRMAAERGGYTLTDRGTYIKYEAGLKGKPPLVVLVEGDASLKNLYSAIAINSGRCNKAQTAKARQLIHWLEGKSAQQQIGQFRLKGKPLFTPMHLK